MSRQSQINANRGNSQHSTGPKSAEGIASSKHNATRHGLTGKQIVIRGEDPVAYDALRHALLAEWYPACENEAMLVEEIAQNWWRLQRARRIEAEIFDSVDDIREFNDRRCGESFDRIQRYVRSAERGWNKARAELGKLQQARKAEELAAYAEQAPQPQQTKTATASIGFVSQSVAAPAAGTAASPVSSTPAGAAQ